VTKWVIVFAKDTYFASVQWELCHSIFFGNGQWNVRQKNRPSKASFFVGNRKVWDVRNGGKPALEVKARGN
jgi:hypothetical protein